MNEKETVSIIIPLYNSTPYFRELMKSWIPQPEMKELILIDDGSPDKISRIIEQLIVKDLKYTVIDNVHNKGFAYSCNAGAKLATGKYVLFLNADTQIIQSHWLSPMVKLIEQHKKTGIVGNIQLDQRNNVQSIGSEWSDQHKQYLHRGRTIWEGKLLTARQKLDSFPDLHPHNVQMTNGSCMLVKDFSGFDESYKIGYWEDADLCCQYKSKGFKVKIATDSQILHHIGHSKKGNHPYMDANKKLFLSKWDEKVIKQI